MTYFGLFLQFFVNCWETYLVLSDTFWPVFVIFRELLRNLLGFEWHILACFCNFSWIAVKPVWFWMTHFGLFLQFFVNCWKTCLVMNDSIRPVCNFSWIAEKPAWFCVPLWPFLPIFRELLKNLLSYEWLNSACLQFFVKNLLGSPILDCFCQFFVNSENQVVFERSNFAWCNFRELQLNELCHFCMNLWKNQSWYWWLIQFGLYLQLSVNEWF